MFDDIVEEYARTNCLAGRDSRLKLALACGAILCSTLASNPLAPALVFLTMSGIVVGIARVPPRVYLSLLAVPSTFLFLSSLVILFMTGTGAPVFSLAFGPIAFHVREGATELVLRTLIRTMGGMSSLFFIALTTPVTELFSAMTALRLPREFVDLAMLVYRFIFLLLGEAIAIFNAQYMRLGYTSFRNSLRAFGMLGSMLFVRAWEKGDAAFLAMEARCYDGRFEPAPCVQRISFCEFAVIVSYLLALAMISFLPPEAIGWGA